MKRENAIEDLNLAFYEAVEAARDRFNECISASRIADIDDDLYPRIMTMESHEKQVLELIESLAGSETPSVAAVRERLLAIFGPTSSENAPDGIVR